METLIIKIDTKEHAREVVALLKKAKGVKSVSKESLKYNWVSPTRPATEDEIKDMISASEASPLLSLEEAKENTYGKLVIEEKGEL